MLRKVLIVDDNEINRALLCRILRNEYEVLEAENGRDALEQLRRSIDQISAVLLDIAMPVMDGYETLTRMRIDSELCNIPVIVTTGNTELDAEMRALSLGANDFVTKPYNPEIIRHRLWNTISLRETAAFVNTIQRDKLTGLYNREAFFLRAEAMIAAQEPGYYIMACFDVDNFKIINDQYGNAKGDEVLRHIARVFREGFAPVGGICGRIMADNFAVLYPSSFMSSPALAEIRRTAARPDGDLRPLSFSIGRYLVTDLSLGVSAMYDRASIAEASVKARFDVRIAQYDESMRESILREQEIVNEMNTALDAGEFVVWLQPQYNHSSGALIGAEALVRWQHPKKGLLPPGLFIPVFERNGFIYELDKYVWEQVCVLLRKWRDEGRAPLPVSVNVSRYDLFREDFFQVITGLAERYAIPLELLRLEITESAFAKSADPIIGMVKRLIEYGFTIEIDDFGSGYSSLNTLKDVPADILKLDMRFLENDKNSSRGGNILESIIRMAKWLGMPVIAEGVETRTQADYLESIGCYYVQGYLYAKPMPAEAYERLIAGCETECEMASLETVETLDNNAFWDPKSMETLIFNSYVGGACIFEYHGGKIELLRVNEKYARELGGDDMSIEAALAFPLEAHMDAKNRAALYENLRTAAQTGVESTCELCLVGVRGGMARSYLRVTARVIARAGSRMLVYCTVINMTAQRQAEQELREALWQLQFLNDIAHDLLTQPDTALGIDGVLHRVLDYFGGNRAYVFELDYAREVMNNSYEVCAPEVRAEKKNLQGVPLRAASFWFHAFEQSSCVNIDDVRSLDESRSEERRILRAQGIRSLVAVPLRREGKLIGFIGVDDPTRQQTHVSRLQAIGDYLTAMLARRDLIEKAKSDNKMLVELMDDTPGGFVRMQALPDGTIVPLYFNGGFCRLVGMDVDTLMELYRESAMAGVHPEDMDTVRAAVAELLSAGEVRSKKYRLRHGNGGYIWVMFFGRRTKNDSGQVFLNVYYTDAQTRQEPRRAELCGAR